MKRTARTSIRKVKHTPQHVQGQQVFGEDELVLLSSQSSNA